MSIGSLKLVIPDGLLLVAVVRRPHGVKGEVSVELVGENPSRLFPESRLVGIRDDGGRLDDLVVSKCRVHRGRYLVGFYGFATRDEAEILRGVGLCVLEEQASPKDDQVWIKDLYGLSVVDIKGHVLGKIVDVLTYPAQDVLEIETSEGRKLLPFVRELVPEVDIEAGRILVNPPSGLFEGEPA